MSIRVIANSIHKPPEAASPVPRHGERFDLAALCLLALAIRLIAAALWPVVVADDETFQYLEQAYRAVTGRGMIPWEYVVGSRSWILAGPLIPVFAAALSISQAPAFYLACVTTTMAIASLTVVWAAYSLGRRVGDRVHGLVCALIAASWCELVYFAPHYLADTVSAYLFIAAIAVCYPLRAPKAHTLVLAGFLFGLTFDTRIQLAPALAVTMVWLCRLDIKGRYAPMAIGFTAALLLLGLVDWLTVGAPYRAVYLYLLTCVRGVADGFGRSPWWYFIGHQAVLWTWASPLIALTAILGARRLPLLAVAGGVILVTFSAVGHKEYRFIYPALPLLFTLCGVGTVDLAVALSKGWRRDGSSAGHPASLGPARVWLLAMVLLWLVASIGAVGHDPMRALWHRDGSTLRALQTINRDPGVCGVGIDGLNWWDTGLVRVRRDLSLYDAAAARDDRAFNVIVAPAHLARPVLSDHPLFRVRTCDGRYGELCLYRRPGPCLPNTSTLLAAPPDPRILPALARLHLLPRSAGGASPSPTP